MNFRDLIHECHRRSLWQVLGIYVAVSWIVFEVVQTLTEGLGLPDWFPGFAFALLLIGLPIVMATAFVQEGGPSGALPEVVAPSAAVETGEGRGSLLAGLLTWGNAIRGGVAALALWGVVAAGWLLLGRGTLDSFQASGPVPIRSVAVLPFANMSDEGANEHFADGLAEELLNVLAKVEGLKVAARTSAFAFKGRDAGIREIGETLGVEAVVEGSVRKQRDRVRITAQLVQVSDGFHLWSDTYDGDLADVFVLQDSVARAIAGALQVTLGIEGRSRRERGLTDDLDAYELYLLGRHHWAQRGDAASLRRIRDYFERAVEADPEFALAYSGLADAHLVAPFYDDAADRTSHRRAREAAARAVQLSPDEPEVQATAGYTAYYADWDLARAAGHLDRAVALGPSYVWGYHYRAVFLSSRGRYRAALLDGREALELDPLSPVVAYQVGRYLRSLDSLEAALPLMERAARSPRPARHWLRDHAIVLGMLGRAMECREAWVEWARAYGYPDLERVRTLWAAYPRWSRPDAMTLDAWADDEALRAWAGEWESLLDDLVERSGVDIGDFGVAYAYFLAGPDRFLEVAEALVEERGVWALYLNDPEFYAALQEDPRYQALLERVGLPPPAGR